MSDFIEIQDGFPVYVKPRCESATPRAGELLAWMTASREQLLETLHHRGAVLMRGFSFPDENQFASAATVLCPTLIEYVGGNSPRTRLGRGIYTATEYPSSARISLHHEASYTLAMPRFILFFCATPPDVGGQTPIADSRRVLKRLAPDLVERFIRKRVKYVNNLHGGYGVGRSWQDAFQTTDKAVAERCLKEGGYEYAWKPDGGLRTSLVCDPVRTHPVTRAQSWVCQADQWHSSNLDAGTREALLSLMKEEEFPHYVCFGDSSPLAESDLKQIRAALDDEVVQFDWQKHDLLICDNILTAHGRQPFTGERRVMVAMG